MIGALIAFAASVAGPPAPAPAANAAAALGPKLAAVRLHARGPGERLWRGYGDAPFGFLLVAAIANI